MAVLPASLRLVGFQQLYLLHKALVTVLQNDTPSLGLYLDTELDLIAAMLYSSSVV